MSTVESFLEHYGVKGQRWGVRRRNRSGDGSNSSGKPRAQDLSDEDLRTAVNRMQMERQYTSLLRGGSGESGARRATRIGAQFASGVAMNVARSTVQTALTRQVNQALGLSDRQRGTAQT